MGLLHVSYSNDNRPEIKFNEVVFLGYGIDDAAYSDYEAADVKGKAILIYDGEPMNANGNSLITGKKELSDWSSDWKKKLLTAKAKGADFVFIIDPNIKKNIEDNRRFLLSSRMRTGDSENPSGMLPNSMYVSSTVAKTIVGKKFKKVVKSRDKAIKSGKLKAVTLSTNLTVNHEKNVNQLIGSNVLGYIEGADPKLKNEVVVVTAHYDHLGKRGESIFYGADDNGSGTSTVIEVCEALVEAKKQNAGPRRSILVMLVSGEEKGLLGSQYYAENPIFPLANTVANVNVDMVGRVDDKYKDNPYYIYVIGSDRLSTELHEINETANKSFTNLTLDYTYNDDNDPNRYYYRSDHYNFAEKGIPAIFYFNGTHEDYHRPSDTVEKIHFEKMAKIGQLVFYTTWELANRDKRIEVNVKGRN
ncbi:MAG: M28 family peptidase [Saprospiraceae bacterium]|nr:M28 family peptidase [Saprospiraceae bacterium]